MSGPHTAFVACLLRTLSSILKTTGSQFFLPILMLIRRAITASHSQPAPPQKPPWASLPFLFTLVTYFLWLSPEQILLGKAVKKISRPYFVFSPPVSWRYPLIRNKYLLIPKEWTTSLQDYHYLGTQTLSQMLYILSHRQQTPLKRNAIPNPSLLSESSHLLICI